MDSKRNKIIGGIAVVTLALFLYLGSEFIDVYINRNPVYVVGYVYHIESNRSGLNFLFFYKYENVTHFAGVTSLDINDYNNLIVLKISRSTPSLWRMVKTAPPACLISIPDVLNKSWNTFPKCNN